MRSSNTGGSGSLLRPWGYICINPSGVPVGLLHVWITSWAWGPTLENKSVTSEAHEVERGRRDTHIQQQFYPHLISQAFNSHISFLIAGNDGKQPAALVHVCGGSCVYRFICWYLMTKMWNGANLDNLGQTLTGGTHSFWNTGRTTMSYWETSQAQDMLCDLSSKRHYSKSYCRSPVVLCNLVHCIKHLRVCWIYFTCQSG